MPASIPILLKQQACLPNIGTSPLCELNAAGLTARFQTLHGYLGSIQESGALICLPIAVWSQAKVFIPVEFPVNVSCFDPPAGRAALVRIKAADCVRSAAYLLLLLCLLPNAAER
jgi:hypothetical protein